MPEKLEGLLKKYEGNYQKFLDSEGGNYTQSNLDSIKRAFDKTGAQYSTRKNVAAASFAGTENDKGDSSLSGNKDAQTVSSVYDELTLLPSSADTKALVNNFIVKGKKVLKENRGKSDSEKEKSASEIISEFSGKKWEKPKEKPAGPLPKVEEKQEPTFKKTAEDIEQAERDKEIDSKSSAFLKSWASTHPSWLKILSSSDLSWGQKVALVGSALANIGANVTLGAKAGFEHSSFNGVPWDFKQAIDKYTENELDTVLKSEQSVKAKTTAAEFWENYRKEKGEEATDELMALVDLYGDNPDVLSSRLRTMGIYKSADEVKDLYANLEKTNLSESAKQKRLETQAQVLSNQIADIQKKLQKNQLKLSDETMKDYIAAQNAMNEFNTTKFSSDKKTYNLEKVAGYMKNVLHEVEGVASTVGGVMTGGVVGGVPSVKDGIIKARGIPQKIVRADGSEIQLDPNDNVYATKNGLTTEKDDGSDIVYMTQADEAVTVQKRLGYNGGTINKDFDYYLSKLRG